MNKLFKDFCGKINFETYKNLKSTFFASGLSVGIVDNILLYDNAFSDLMMCLFMCAYMYLEWSNGINYTKDINEINVLYKEFISNYNKMNKMFGNNEPISIYALYNYLLYEGYLSLNHEFKFTNKNVCDLSIISGASINRGVGVCRHISSMLRDIYNDYGIDSLSLGCLLRRREIDVKAVSKEEYSREDNLDIINKFNFSDEQKEVLIQTMDELIASDVFVKYVIKYVADKKWKVKRAGNHAITYALYDDEQYFLDPTQSRIYRLKEGQKGILYDSFDDNIDIKKRSINILNKTVFDELTVDKNRIFIPGESISLEEEKKILESVRKNCLDNKDIFEKFYNENKEIYEEIDSKMNKVRKK